MDSWELRHFLMILECGSITQAAEKLGVGQPTLSLQLRRLEDELGVELFNRTSRGVVATESGLIFEKHARKLLHAMEEAREDVKAKGAAPEGRVGFAMPSSTSQLVGSSLLLSCRERLPRVALKITEANFGSILPWLMENGGIDLAVVFWAEDLPNLSARWIADETLFLIGKPGEFGEVDDHGVAREPVSPDLLQTANIILPSLQKPLLRQMSDRAGAPSLNLKFATELDSLVQIREAVAAGVGYSLLPHSAVSNELSAGRLSAARMAGVNFTRSMWLARNPAAVVTRASEAVEALALEIFQQLIDEGRWYPGG